MSAEQKDTLTALRAPAGDTTWLKGSFVQVQAKLIADIKLASHSISHGGVMGSVNEEHWIELFRQYLPNRYEVATGIVIDSHGNRSEQIDLVVFDRHFTPTLLTQKNHRYIPAEAVYGVFECKPVIDQTYVSYAQGKAASVRRMHRTSVAISYAAGTYEPKQHFRMLAGILAPTAEWVDGLGEAFERSLSDDPERLLDCGVALQHGCFDRYDGSLLIMREEGALIFFLFRLLARLQSLGTVPAIDWSAYSRVIRP